MTHFLLLALISLAKDKLAYGFTTVSPLVVARHLQNGAVQIQQQSFEMSTFSSFPHCSAVTLFMVTSADVDSTDPFVVLGLDPNDRDSLEKKVIKRAYKRLALKYHPDVVVNRESSEAERKAASDRFAKINAAYETLIGKGGGGNGAFRTAASSSGSSSSGWTPPHRRKAGERAYSSNSGPGVSWEDFMPKYDESQYDADGDSFGAIFADLLAGAASSMGGSGSGGLFQDFVEFLEESVDGYGFSNSGESSVSGKNDADLDFLLRTGSLDDVANEMDDTDLVVQQLTSKLRDLENEVIEIQADVAASTRFSQKIELEEREAECNARKKVVEKYLKQARSRLLSLQTRYKQLITGGANDSKAGGRSRTSSRSWKSDSSSTGTSSYRSTASPGTKDSYSSSRQAAPRDPEESWKTEGFGSSSRGRGSGRRRASRTTSRGDSHQTNESTQSKTSGTPSSSEGVRSRATEMSEKARTSPLSSTRSYSSGSNIPPHRRSGPVSSQDDKQRLRDLKVDDEFEKLKKELGL